MALPMERPAPALEVIDGGRKHMAPDEDAERTAQAGDSRPDDKKAAFMEALYERLAIQGPDDPSPNDLVRIGQPFLVAVRRIVFDEANRAWENGWEIGFGEGADQHQQYNDGFKQGFDEAKQGFLQLCGVLGTLADPAFDTGPLIRWLGREGKPFTLPTYESGY